MYKRLYKFLSDFHILFDFQFGFRSKHSTDLALIHFVDHLNSSLTRKLSSVGVFITNFLGVTIDDKRTWSDHISSISKTISRKVGVLSKLRSLLPPANTVSLHNTLISPYLTSFK